MGFWKTVNEYLLYKEIPRRQLSDATGIKIQTINRAIQRDSEPTLQDGLKICAFLKIQVEDFVSVSTPYIVKSNTNKDLESQNEINLYRKYHKLIKSCENLSESNRKIVFNLAKSLAESSNN